MVSITPKGLFNYLITLLKVPRIIRLIHTAKGLKPFLPEFRVMETCGPSIGGCAFKQQQLIHISSWILQDASVAKGVVRHELAHLIHTHIDTGGTAHGKEFSQILRIVSPRGWRKDKHFRWEPEIVKAYTQIHPNNPMKKLTTRKLFIPFRATVSPMAFA